MDVFPKFLFAVALTSALAGTAEKALFSALLQYNNIPTTFQHSYIPTTLLSYLGTSFEATLLHELAALLEINLQHAPVKPPQGIGLVESSLSALKNDF